MVWLLHQPIKERDMYDQNRTNELIEAADQWYQEAGELLKRLNSK